MTREKYNYILGVHIGHDRGAAIVHEGLVLSAIAEERLDRVKYSPSDRPPYLSIRYVLDVANIPSNTLPLVVITHSGGPINNEIEESWQRELSALLDIEKSKIII